MDLISIGRTALLVPVKGQTEQEYLCRYLSGQKLFVSLAEEELDLQKYGNYINQLKVCKTFEGANGPNLPILTGK
jgi:hypothetical protein